MKILELFAGSRSIGRAAEALGHEVFSVDINNFDGIDLVADIEYLRAKDIPFVPDMVWGSPMCTTYSVAAISHHRSGCKPKSEFAEKSDRVVLNTLKIVNEFGCIYYIENPVGMLRKMPFMRGIDRTTITYCSYGDNRMKPTDIWSNNIYGLFNPYGWRPRPKCHNNNKNCHHEPSPRGSRTGTQGLRGGYERSKIPDTLCVEVIEATNNLLTKKQ